MGNLRIEVPTSETSIITNNRDEEELTTTDWDFRRKLRLKDEDSNALERILKSVDHSEVNTRLQQTGAIQGAKRFQLSLKLRMEILMFRFLCLKASTRVEHSKVNYNRRKHYREWNVSNYPLNRGWRFYRFALCARKHLKECWSQRSELLATTNRNNTGTETFPTIP